MNTQAPQTPGPGGMANDPKDPTQRLPEAPAETPAMDDEARRILEQQHTGNHQKPGDESADKRGGTRVGAENVEHDGGAQKDRETG